MIQHPGHFDERTGHTQTSCADVVSGKGGVLTGVLLRAGPGMSPFQQVHLHLSDVVKTDHVKKLCRAVRHNIHIPGTSWIMQNKPVLWLFDLLLVWASMRGESWCECVHGRHLFQEDVLVKVWEWYKCFHYLENTPFTLLIKEAASANTWLWRTAFDTWAALSGEGRTPPAGVGAVASLQYWISRCWSLVRHPSSWYYLCQN